MKLSDYLPEVPTMANRMSELNGQIAQLELMKSGGATGQAPTIGLDHIVNTWVRHQMAYRQQLILDVQMACSTCSVFFVGMYPQKNFILGVQKNSEMSYTPRKFSVSPENFGKYRNFLYPQKIFGKYINFLKNPLKMCCF